MCAGNSSVQTIPSCRSTYAIGEHDRGRVLRQCYSSLSAPKEMRLSCSTARDLCPMIRARLARCHNRRIQLPSSPPPPLPTMVNGPSARMGGREDGLPSSCERVYHTVLADTAFDGRDGADPWGYRAALTSPGTAAMCPMAGKLEPRNGMDWTSGSSTYLVCAAAGAPVQSTAYSAPE